MKKTTLCIWFILILIMAGCGEKKPASDIIVPTEYVFSGENDLWKGDYRVTRFRTFDGEDPSQGELKKTSYREEFLHVEQMETSYTVKSRSQSLDVLDHETIHVTITMDDKTEKLELTKK